MGLEVRRRLGWTGSELFGDDFPFTCLVWPLRKVAFGARDVTFDEHLGGGKLLLAHIALQNLAAEGVYRLALLKQALQAPLQRLLQLLLLPALDLFARCLVYRGVLGASCAGARSGRTAVSARSRSRPRRSRPGSGGLCSCSAGRRAPARVGGWPRPGRAGSARAAACPSPTASGFSARRGGSAAILF